jgi:hypothetical protein
MFRSDDTHEVCLVWGQRYDSKRNYPRSAPNCQRSFRYRLRGQPGCADCLKGVHWRRGTWGTRASGPVTQISHQTRTIPDGAPHLP